MDNIKWNRPVAQIIKPALDAKKQIFLQAVSDEIAIIAARTTAGKDADEQSFAPYVPSYAKRREKNNDQVSPPNLTVTGHMLGSMRRGATTETETSITTTIEFGSETEANKARGNMKKRKFFALSDEQIKEITKRVNEG
jgi:hypothetical protein